MTTVIEDLLERCTEDGVITPDQAELMRVYAARDRRPGPTTGQLVVEALGYLGGAIVLAGSLLIGAQYWGDLGTGSRSAVLGTGTVLLLTAGRLAPAGSSGLGSRLRSVLWLVSLGCSSGLLALVGDRILELGDRGLPLFVAAGCATYALALWFAHRTALLQIAMMAAAGFTAATALHRVFDANDVPGLGVWATGLAWIVLGHSGRLEPRRLTLVLGSATAILGAMLTSGSDAGMVLTLVTVAAVVAASVLVRDLVLLAVGALGTFANVPAALSVWFPDSVAAAFVLVVAGTVLVGVAVAVAVRGKRPGSTPPGHVR